MRPRVLIAIGAWTFAAAMILIGNANHCEAEGDEALKQAIFDAWAKREAATKSVKFEWTQNGESRISGLFRPNREQVRKNYPGAGEYVPVEQTSSLRFDGERIDYRLDTLEAEKLSMPRGLRCSFDGQTSQDYSGISLPGAFGSGVITNEPHAFGTGILYIRPLILAYRPFHPTISKIPKQNLYALPERVPIGEYSCVVLAEVPGNVILHRYFVDADNEYVVRGYATTVEGRDSSRVDIQYERDSDDGFVPKKWECITLDGAGECSSSRICTVTHYEINHPIPLEEFQIEFPVGTRVEDRVRGRTYRVGEGELTNSRSRWVLIAGVNIALIAALGIVVIVRRHKWKRS